MRRYRSTSGIERKATMERIEESYGPYFGSHVLVSTESERGRAYGRVANYAEGVKWLQSHEEFGCGWIRER